MKYRKLRLAWSAGGGVLAVLLCVLWARSYSHMDVVFGPLSPTCPFKISSEVGRVSFAFSDVSIGRAGNWGCYSYRYGTVMPAAPPKSGVTASPSTIGFGIPHWLFAAAFGFAAVVSCTGKVTSSLRMAWR